MCFALFVDRSSAGKQIKTLLVDIIIIIIISPYMFIEESIPNFHEKKKITKLDCENGRV